MTVIIKLFYYNFETKLLLLYITIYTNYLCCGENQIQKLNKIRVKRLTGRSFDLFDFIYGRRISDYTPGRRTLVDFT